jgi:hypothetical protein
MGHLSPLPCLMIQLIQIHFIGFQFMQEQLIKWLIINQAMPTTLGDAYRTWQTLFGIYEICGFNRKR